MKRSLIILLCTALTGFTLAGCLEDDATDEKKVRVAFSVLESGDFSDIVSQRFELIRDEEKFAELWLAHTTNAQPEVDFEQDMVAAVFLGEVGGGIDIAITEVEERQDSLLVNVRITFPGENCAVPQGFFQPFQIITMPRSEKLVAFSTEIERVDCP